MAVITYLPGIERPEVPDVDLDAVHAEWPTSAPRTPWRRRALASLRPTEIKLLTVAALALYVASGLWTRFDLHFWINDALNRSDDALYTAIGRDPHLGAIGFYWPPLPQLLELPFMPILRPFGEEILAGPLMTAVCMAATIPVLARLGRRLALRRGTVFLLCLAFAITPDMVYTASNGMAESCFILSGAVTMLGFLTWIDTHSTSDLLVFTLGLSMLVMTRLEGPLVSVFLAVVAAINLRHLRRSAWDFAKIMLPPTFCFGFWMLIQWILLGDPFFFNDQKDAGGSSGPTFWLPPGIYRNATVDARWVLGWVLVLAPVIYLLVATLVVGPLSRRFRGSVGILASLGAILLIQFAQAYLSPADFGDPRYFVMAVIFGVVAAFWLASGSRRPLARVYNLGLVVLLLVGACTGSYQLTSGRVTHIEQECSYFQYGVARIVPELGRAQYGPNACQRTPALTAWRRADAWVDTHLHSRDRILADNSNMIAAELFTTKPDLFIVRNDRDWEKTVAYPTHVDYIMTFSPTRDGTPSLGAYYEHDDGALLVSLDPRGWHLAASYGLAESVSHTYGYIQIWHFVPGPGAGATPTGTETGI